MKKPLKIVNSLITRRALSIAMKKKAPDVIALTGKKARDNNCFSAVLDGPYVGEILVSAVGAHGIVGRAWSGERFENETIIPNEHLGEFAVRISRYFGEHYFDYNSALSCIVGEISWRPWRTLVVNKIVQQVFNAKTPIRSKRIRILKRLIQDRIDDAITHGGLTRRDFQGKSAIQLLGEIHGLRIVRHPEFKSLLADLLLTLESLCESGDALQRPNEIGYVATKQARRTIAEYEEQNLRHKRQMSQNRALIALTVVLAIASSAQAYFAWKGLPLSK